MTWTSILKGDPTPWLLEPEDPAVRYRALRDLLDRPEDDPQVQEAKAAIPTMPPASTIFAAQKRDGWWGKTRDYYTPKHYSTFWVLTVLADLGLTAEDERVRRGYEFMFDYQRESGAPSADDDGWQARGSSGTRNQHPAPTPVSSAFSFSSATAMTPE